MSIKLRNIQAESTTTLSREALLSLRPDLEYEDGRTQQTFKDETNINRIMERAQVTGTISHLSKYEGRYADFSDFDFFEHQRKLTEARELFDQTPSEIRKEFDNRPEKFFAYVNDPANKDRLAELLPGLAKPGRQVIDVSGKTPPAASAAPSEPSASEPAPADPPAEPPPASPPAAPSEGS